MMKTGIVRMGTLVRRRAGVVIGVALVLLLTGTATAAPGDITNCSEPLNISNSEGYSSADSFLLEDAAGRVHLFWGERTVGDPGDVPNTPDSLMYAVWDKESWSKPIDIFISPADHLNRLIAGITGIIDDDGNIHITWIGPDSTLFYSSAHSSDAASVHQWRKPSLLSEDLTDAQHTAQIGYEPPHTLHIAYGRSNQGSTNSLEYIRSDDGGVSWSEPVLLYDVGDFGRGVSNTRMLVDLPGKVYVTWTEWDRSGNGQAIYFMRSLDGGDTWDQPVLLDKRVGDEYERDYVNLASLNDGRLVAFWEGGFRAYPQAQYSDDGGETWSKPIDTFWWLIADNGFAEYVRDSAGRLHLFIIRRIREGNSDRCEMFPACGVADGTNAIWHSVWDGGTSWRSPTPLFFGGGNRVNAAIENGKYVHLAWFNFVDLEIRVMRCEIDGTDAVAPRVWPTPTPSPSPTVTPTEVPPATPTPRPQLRSTAGELDTTQAGTQALALAAVLPALAVVGAAVVILRLRP